ncbi:Ger(x)C family spore germination protein [Alicyclobacillus acidoterrestris]|uniref:Ger(X)C family spore germination protein n=1 Tax=Alicyclobacillus acidoterrestris (strain ATCC 49025 / DSM 3922 / CIP 106132 / NCIMB 13137 / GD3B) TaxID=1356854 RepID=T0CZT5_ALIAG|nr:Ger(x)C family spore germination protein [Alicyclobacillus acidoterrestris]EPZ43031.1 hypothetical protein N007_01440 [Alicyclobacillus acidoterrestris ATCC 49025]UNO49824.1 Ger(x)C family spore germination protein [Alicyclobacillus acidoterrestris]
MRTFQKALFYSGMILFCMIFVTGCWDKHELNDRAIIMGVGLDQGDDDSVIISMQIARPSGLGTNEQPENETGAFEYVESTGKNWMDAAQHSSFQISRYRFFGQRRVIFIGEKLARRGLKNTLDEFSRYTQVRLRTDMIVIQGGEARDQLKKSRPFERVPVLSDIKLHTAIGGKSGDTTFRDFLMDVLSDGASPTLVSMNGNQVTGRAVFNSDLQLVGYLTMDEAINRLWITGGLKQYVYTFRVPQFNGLVSLQTSKFKRDITTKISGNKAQIHIALSAVADLQENDSSVDMYETHHLQTVQQAFNHYLQKSMTDMVKRTQTEYGIDVLQLGEVIHRQHPIQWKDMKSDWNCHGYKNAQITVSVHTTIKRAGLTTLPLQLNEGDQ